MILEQFSFLKSCSERVKNRLSKSFALFFSEVRISVCCFSPNYTAKIEHWENIRVIILL